MRQGLEYGVQGTLALTLLLSGNWFSGFCHLAILGYMVHLWAGGKVYVDTTDAFRQLPQQKRQRLVQLGAHTVLFMLVVYRSVECGIGSGAVAAGARMHSADSDMLLAWAR